MPHCPPAHVAEPLAGAGQVLPHTPQLRVSLSRRRQDVPQGDRPPLQRIPQVPPVHLAEPFTGTGQVRLHALQCAGFVLVLTHAPEQRVVPAGHRLTQRPPEQAWSAPQRMPQPPQLLASEDVAMQTLPQRAKPF